METLDVEVPTDLETFRHWFARVSAEADWLLNLQVDDWPAGDAHEWHYILLHDGETVAGLHLYHFRRDRLRILALQFTPWRDDGRFIVDRLDSWLTHLYGADQVREFGKDATAEITDMTGWPKERAYWMEVHKQATASENIREYLACLEIPHSSYYDAVKRYRLSENSDTSRTSNRTRGR